MANASCDTLHYLIETNSNKIDRMWLPLIWMTADLPISTGRVVKLFHAYIEENPQDLKKTTPLGFQIWLINEKGLGCGKNPKHTIFDMEQFRKK